MFLPLNLVSSGHVCYAGPAPIAPIYNSDVCALFFRFHFHFRTRSARSGEGGKGDTVTWGGVF